MVEGDSWEISQRVMMKHLCFFYHGKRRRANRQSTGVCDSSSSNNKNILDDLFITIKWKRCGGKTCHKDAFLRLKRRLLACPLQMPLPTQQQTAQTHESLFFLESLRKLPSTSSNKSQPYCELFHAILMKNYYFFIPFAS